MPSEQQPPVPHEAATVGPAFDNASVSEPVPDSAIDIVDAGLLSPVTTGHDAMVSDAAITARLIEAEIALTRAWASVGVAPAEVADEVTAALTGDALAEFDFGALVSGAVSGGNPVILLVGMLRALVPEHARPWIHRGATSQDIMDTALMMTAYDAGIAVLASLVETSEALADFVLAHREETAAGRTLTQHAVPTTVGLRAAGWARGVERAAIRLDDAVMQLPAQLGGAGGTLASFVAIGGKQAALALPAAFAEETDLSAPDAPWHTQRWPVTELGDALVQTLDALGRIAADVVTLSRTEIGELAEGAGGGSSAMPQKRNPAVSVLIRSAAIRAPHLGATLHSAAALAVDERPDGAWHAEWQALRELLRLALGAAEHAANLVAGLRVDPDAVRRNLDLTGGLILAERLNLILAPEIGADRVKQIINEAGRGASLADLLLTEAGQSEARIAELLDPSGYTGLASQLIDDFFEPVDPEHHHTEEQEQQ